MHWLQGVSLRSAFWLLLSVVLVIRIAWVFFLPLSAEEMTLAASVSAHPLLLRLPHVLLPLFVAGFMPQVLREEDEELGYVAAIVWLSLPPQLLDPGFGTSAFLPYFAFASVALFYPAVRDEDHIKHLGAGLFLGLAVLADGYGVLLAAAYLIFALISPTRERRSLDVLIVFAAAAAVLLAGLAWKDVPRGQAWFSISETGSQLSRAAYFVGALILAAGPHLFLPVQRASEWRRAVCDMPATRALWIVALVPVGSVLLLSPWIASPWRFVPFLPALTIAATLLLSRESALRIARWMLALAFLCLLAQAALPAGE